MNLISVAEMYQKYVVSEVDVLKNAPDGLYLLDREATTRVVIPDISTVHYRFIKGKDYKVLDESYTDNDHKLSGLVKAYKPVIIEKQGYRYTVAPYSQEFEGFCTDLRRK